MIFVFGHSGKQQVVREEPGECGRCRRPVLQQLVRLYRVFHVFWFPLFSGPGKWVRRCAACGASTSVEKPPAPVPAKPFLHRFGFLFPIGLVAVPVLIGAVAAGWRSATLDPATAAAEARLSALERRLREPGPWGGSDEAKELSAAVHEALATNLHGGDRARAAVAAELVDGPHRQALVVVRVPSLRKWDDHDRQELLAGLSRAADSKLRTGDGALIAVKGEVLFGPVAVRPGGGAWSYDSRATGTRELLIRAYLSAGGPKVP